MGNYASQTELQNHIGGSLELARLTATSGSTPNATIVTQEIDLAEAEVDGYLAKRYATPVDLTATPDMEDWLKQLTLKIATWRLYHRVKVPNKAAKQDYDDAIKQLADFIAGDIAAPGGTAPAGSVTQEPSGVWGGEDAKATASTMEGL